MKFKHWLTTWTMAGAMALPYVAAKREMEHRDNLASIRSAVEQRVDEHDSTRELKPFYMKPAHNIPKYLEKQPEPFDPQAKMDDGLIRAYINEAFKRVDNIPSEVTPEFVRKIIYIESSGKPCSVSDKGARGLTQLMQDTWEGQTKHDFELAFDPYTSIEEGVKYLSHIGTRYGVNSEEYKNFSTDQQQRAVASGFHGGYPRVIKKDFKLASMGKNNNNYLKKLGKRS